MFPLYDLEYFSFRMYLHGDDKKCKQLLYTTYIIIYKIQNSNIDKDR